MKNCILILSLIFFGNINSQHLQKVTSQSFSVKAGTADSSNYYFVSGYNATTNSSGLHKSDENNNVTDLMSFDSQSYLFNYDQAFICNNGNCLLGKSGASTTSYYLFHAGLIDSVFSSKAAFLADQVIVGSQVYFHDTQKIYKSGLSGVNDLEIIYTSPDATNFTGIGQFFKVGNSIIYTEYTMGMTYLKRLDLQTKNISILDSLYGTTGSMIYQNELYYLNGYDINKKIRKVGSTGLPTTLFTELGGLNYKIFNFFGANTNGLVVSIYEGSYLIPALIKNNIVTPINLKTAADPYPNSASNYYQSGNYFYFLANDTVPSVSSFNRAVWVTDGTKSGTKKMVSDGSPNMPFALNGNKIGGQQGNCFEDFWIGGVSKNTIHFNHLFNIVENSSTMISANYFFNISSNKYVFFQASNTWGGPGNVYKISCDVPASIQELDASNVKLFPMPVSDILHLEFDAESPATTITLVDLNGSVLWRKKSTHQQYDIDFSQVSSGMYLLHLENEISSSTHRIIKE